MGYNANAINTMQKYLSILRKVNGWTTEELGKRIGVTKQTISNLENNKVTMSKTQYIALRTVFEYEVRIVNTNMTLKRILCLLFYEDNKSIKENKDIFEVLENIAAAAAGGISGKQLSLLSMTLLSSSKIAGANNLNLEMNVEPYKWLEEIIAEEDV